MAHHVPNRIGLALGGGGARGLCHIGVLRVLEELEITPSVISGTSMGGLVGAFIAAGYSADDLEKVLAEVKWATLIDWRPGKRLLNSKSFESWLARLLPATFAELRLPLVLTASDIITGQISYLSDGDLYTAIRATTAFPGATEPVTLGASLLIDGGILNQIPVDGALFLGAQKVVAVNATALEPLELPNRDQASARRKRHLGPLGELTRAVDVMQTQLTMARLSLYRPDVFLDPHMDGLEVSDFHKSVQAVAAGEAAAREQLGKLRALVV